MGVDKVSVLFFHLGILTHIITKAAHSYQGWPMTFGCFVSFPSLYSYLSRVNGLSGAMCPSVVLSLAPM